MLREGPIVFTAGSRTYEVRPDEIGLLIDEYRLLGGSLLTATYRLLMSMAFFSLQEGAKTVMAAPVTVDLPETRDILGEITSGLSEEPQGSRYEFVGRDLVVVPPSEGQVVTREDVALALQDIEGTRVEVRYTPRNAT